MEIREVVINNKAIEKISYYAYNKDDSQMLAIKNKIHAVWNNHFIDRRGYKRYIEQCFLDASDADIITIQTYYLEDDYLFIQAMERTVDPTTVSCYNVYIRKGKCSQI